MIRTVSKENEQLVEVIGDVFDEPWSAAVYGDDEGRSKIDILDAPNSPLEGFTSYSTIGLSDYPLLDQGRDVNLRVEIVAAADSDVEFFPNVLATAAFCVINSHWFCYPGRVFCDVLAINEVSTRLPHILFVPPFSWEKEFETVTFETKTVAWLEIIPISERELQYAREKGEGALEDLFERVQLDCSDLDRESVV